MYTHTEKYILRRQAHTHINIHTQKTPSLRTEAEIMHALAHRHKDTQTNTHTHTHTHSHCAHTSSHTHSAKYTDTTNVPPVNYFMVMEWSV